MMLDRETILTDVVLPVFKGSAAASFLLCILVAVLPFVDSIPSLVVILAATATFTVSVIGLVLGGCLVFYRKEIK